MGQNFKKWSSRPARGQRGGRKGRWCKGQLFWECMCEQREERNRKRSLCPLCRCAIETWCNFRNVLQKCQRLIYCLCKMYCILFFFNKIGSVIIWLTFDEFLSFQKCFWVLPSIDPSKSDLRSFSFKCCALHQTHFNSPVDCRTESHVSGVSPVFEGNRIVFIVIRPKREVEGVHEEDPNDGRKWSQSKIQFIRTVRTYKSILIDTVNKRVVGRNISSSVLMQTKNDQICLSIHAEFIPHQIGQVRMIMTRCFTFRLIRKVASQWVRRICAHFRLILNN